MSAAALTVAAAVAGLAARALWFEPRRVVVRRHDLRLEAWPASRGGLRVVALADLHAGAPHVGLRRLERIVSLAQAERPDLVVLLGDLIDERVLGGRALDPDAVAARLAAVRAPLGVVGVLGNHDWTTGGGRVARALEAAGVRMLENQAVAVADGDDPVWVAGLADASKRLPDIGRALAGVPPDAAVLLLSHDPDVFPLVPARVALTLSGHTHGGQVALPLVRRRWIPSRFGERYAGGLVTEGTRRLVISRGIGTSKWPIRLGAPPEIVVLRLFANVDGGW